MVVSCVYKGMDETCMSAAQRSWIIGPRHNSSGSVRAATQKKKKKKVYETELGTIFSSCPDRTYRTYVPASLWVPTNLPADQAGVSGLIHCWGFPRPPGKSTNRVSDMVQVLKKIAKIFGWPIAIYCDNASYFVKGQVPEELKIQQVMQFSAPITHPSSVGLSERYVQLVLTELRTVLAHENLPLERWDSCLDTVVFAINTRILRIHESAVYGDLTQSANGRHIC